MQVADQEGAWLFHEAIFKPRTTMTLLVENGERFGFRNFLAVFDFADLAGEDEFDFALRNLLVELHCAEELLLLRRVEADFGGKAGALEQSADAFGVGCG